ncbi:Hypothetical protein LUCI_3728 [Lucifera butyrica]|uniref:HTH cro/C1-type domain-containing protein n=1 Tax=Lucifera butyrica TaxID=1351585 RepID=A0A498R6V2_9FIRM|nr:helix-turn-helix transcriptional regulator [Lucifera butyrica]VBB08456.1 Hypothetical protein LUCI_3728 [Lucifera butyrica]
MEILAQRLLALREAKNWSQAELAKKASIPQGTISKIEQKKLMPRADTLLKIAVALNSTTSYLLGETAA